MRAHRAHAVLLVLALALTSAERARAQSPNDQMLAQSLFDEARALMDQKRFDEACPKLAESQRLDPGGGTILNLAVCHERQGKVATAFTEMNAALAQAMRDGRKDRESVARDHLAQIRARIPKIAVHVVREEEGLEVRLDGTPVRKPAWDVAAGVDPGEHVLEAEVPGKSPRRWVVVVGEGEEKTVEVPSFTPPPVQRAQAATDADVEPTPTRRKNPVYYGALAVGVTGIVVGTVSGLVWLQARSEAGTSTGSAAASAQTREQTFGGIAAVSLGVAAAGLLTMLIVPSSLSASIAPQPGGATMTASITLP